MLAIALTTAAACVAPQRTTTPMPLDRPPDRPRDGATAAAPSLALAPVPQLCVTKGALAARGATTTVSEPTVRAFAAGTRGDAVSLAFRFLGDAETKRALASGQLRRQLGVKLRAANSCNVVYVMWRLDPRPMLEVSVKSNPGLRTHEECGASGYTKVRPERATDVPALVPGSTHLLHAEIRGDELLAWIDRELAWIGVLPPAARAIVGPAGFRSDNVALEILELAAPSAAPVACRPQRGDDS